MNISTQFILFSVEVDLIATPVADFSLCIFDHYSFIFCVPGTDTKLLHGMIYDFPSQQCMKNKLDFPTPFPDQPPPPALPPFHHTCLPHPADARDSWAVKQLKVGSY